MKRLLLCLVFGFLMIACSTKGNEKMGTQQNEDAALIETIQDCEYIGNGVITHDCVMKRLAHYCQNKKDKASCEVLTDDIKHFEESCIKGEVWGCHNLGVSYEKGYGVKQDFFVASQLYKEACDLNLMSSCFNLAIFYKNGQGVRQDFTLARNYHEKACNANHAGACNNLGILYSDGKGVRQNLSTAKKYYGKACDLGEQVGCDNYKILNEQGVK